MGLTCLMISCLKNVKPSDSETNVFDPNYDGPRWFEEVGIDSTQIAGSFYFYNLRFQLRNEDLISRKQNYTLKIRKWDKTKYINIYPSATGNFKLELQTPERINGKFTLEIALFGSTNTKEVSVKHISQW